MPAGVARPRHALAGRIWHTLGAYFRGQLLVATVDAALIGLGLWLLQIPLALPLAFVVFLGGLFPIVSAVVSDSELPDQHLAVPIGELMEPVEPADLVEAVEPLDRLWPRLHRRPRHAETQALVIVRDGRPVAILTRRPATPAAASQAARQPEGDFHAV
jgi:hypothetical protein